jgi:hypothetical protein
MPCGNYPQNLTSQLLKSDNGTFVQIGVVFVDGSKILRKEGSGWKHLPSR